MEHMARTYTDSDRLGALTALELNGGNVLRASKSTGIPRPTIITWRDQAIAATPELTLALTHPDTPKTDFGALLGEAVQDAVRHLRAALPTMQGRDLAVATGILIDKHLDYTQGRRGMTTAFTVNNDNRTQTLNVSDEELRDASIHILGG